MLNAQDWEEIEQAYTILVKSKMSKLEGKVWSMYKIGNNIRIDIKESK